MRFFYMESFKHASIVFRAFLRANYYYHLESFGYYWRVLYKSVSVVGRVL